MPPAGYAEEGSLPAPRLAFLDGLRGLAALYVVLHHAALMVPPEGMSGPEVPARFLLRHGRYAVAVFIVLSGFCLMLPVTCNRDGRLPGGLLAFFARRIRRIVPAYYAALVSCCLLVALVPALAQTDHARWDRALPAWGQGILLSHLFLVHNLNGRWIFKLDPPMWSVATEWQIYLFFPALLWLWRRAGLAVTVASGFTTGVLVMALSYALNNPALRELCPWYLGLFALGMSAAVASCDFPSGTDRGQNRRARALALVVMLAIVLGAIAGATPSTRYLVVADALIGGLTATLLVRWTRSIQSTRTPLVRLLESRWAIRAGAFSYSLYLTHYPLLAFADATLRAAGSSPGARFWTLCLGASPFCVLAAYVFHCAFERPFLAPRASVGSAIPRPRLELAGVPGPGVTPTRVAYWNHRSEP